MRWVKIAGVCLAVIIAVGLVSFIIKMIEFVIVLTALMVVVAIAVWLYRALESAQSNRVQRQRAKEARKGDDRTRMTLDEELEQLKRDVA